MRIALALVLVLLAVPAFGGDAAKVAALVHETDAARLDVALPDALRSTDALTRATAARVAGVREVKSSLPAIRERILAETDHSAVREQLRTLALLGEESDVDLAIQAASKLPEWADLVVSDAVARRGGADAVNLYLTKLRSLRRMSDFFERALWNRPALIEPAATRLLAVSDERGWQDLLDALYDAALVLPPANVTRGLGSHSDGIRSATAWYLVRGYANDATKIAPDVRTALLGAQEVASDREAFARELLRRMLGQTPVESERWTKWLATPDADALMSTETSVHLTMNEFAVREKRCKSMPVSCPLPKAGRKRIEATPVRPSPFVLPGTLPPGLDQELKAQVCNWFGLVTATVDPAGRVQNVDYSKLSTSCRETLSTVMKLSYATNATMTSPTTASEILLVKATRGAPCLDEHEEDVLGPRRVTPEVSAPVVKKRVEPGFPSSVRSSMSRATDVLVVGTAVISRTGCVRSVGLTAQSPYPQLNASVLAALSQWTFEPARLDGKPIDVIFDLTVSFRLN